MGFKLGELADYIRVQGGFAYKSKDFQNSGTKKVLKIKNIRFGYVDYNDAAYISDELAHNTHSWATREGDILISMTGSGPSAPQSLVGRVARVWAGDETAWINQRVGRIVLKEHGSIHPDFIFYLLSQKSSQDFLVANSSGSANQANISGKTIEMLPCPLISYEDSSQIATILLSLDQKINLNHQINQTLEQMAQTLFKSWFVDFDPVIDNALDASFFEQDLAFSEELLHRVELRKTVRESDNFKPLPEDIRRLFPDAFEECAEPALGLGGWIPTSWSHSNVGAEFDVTMGQSPPGSTYNEIGIGLPFFQGKTDFGFRFPKNRVYCTAPKRMANKNDTLISVRAPVGDINLAAEDCAIGRGVAAARHKSGSISFTYYSMNSLSKYFEVFEGEGTVFGSINQKDFKALLFIKYPFELIYKFDVFCLEWDKRIDVQSIENMLLTQLRDTLLPKLISGELSLDDIKIDIPEETLI